MDIFLLKNGDNQDLDEKQLNQARENSLKELALKFNEQSKDARLLGEENKKLKSMMQVRFGDFTALVPQRNVARHFDYPLAESMADFEAETSSEILENLGKGKTRAGQLLKGCMIPTLNADYDKFQEELLAPEVELKIKALHSVACNRKDRLSPEKLARQELEKRMVHSAPALVSKSQETSMSPNIALRRSNSERHHSHNKGDKKSLNFEKSESGPKNLFPLAVSTVDEDSDEEGLSCDDRDSTSIDNMRDLTSRREDNASCSSEKTGDYHDEDQGVEIIAQGEDRSSEEEFSEDSTNSNSKLKSTLSPTYRASNNVDIVFLRR